MLRLVYAHVVQVCVWTFFVTSRVRCIVWPMCAAAGIRACGSGVCVCGHFPLLRASVVSCGPCVPQGKRRDAFIPCVCRCMLIQMCIFF
jgi:hypothetical protein